MLTRIARIAGLSAWAILILSFGFLAALWLKRPGVWEPLTGGQVVALIYAPLAPALGGLLMAVAAMVRDEPGGRAARTWLASGSIVFLYSFVYVWFWMFPLILR